MPWGGRFGAETQAVAAMVRAADPAALAHAVAATGGMAPWKSPPSAR